MPHTISNDDNLINADDVIARIAALQKSQQVIKAELETLERENSASNQVQARRETLKDSQQDMFAELEALESVAEQASDSTEWREGIALIRDSYFAEYAQEFAKDTLMLYESLSWDTGPLSCIDWERAARQLKADYSPIDFDGVRYWIQCE